MTPLPDPKENQRIWECGLKQRAGKVFYAWMVRIPAHPEEKKPIQELADVLGVSPRAAALLAAGKYRSWKIFRQITRNLRRVSKADRDQLKLKEFARELGLLKPQPNRLVEFAQLKIPRLDWNPGLPPSALLRAECGVVPFHGRDKERQDLKDWLVGTDQFAIRLYTGPGGIGKTRLAIAACEDAAAAGWISGFADLRYAPMEREICSRLLADQQQILLVVDYANACWSHLQPFLHLAINGGTQTTKVRVILLSRSSGDWWDPCKAKTGDRFRCERLRMSELAAGEEQRRDSFRLGLAAFTQRLGAKLPEGCESAIDFCNPLYHEVLFLHMEALLGIEGVQAEGEDGVLNAMLARERLFWSLQLRARGLSSALEPAVAVAMTAITLNEGVRDIEEGLELLGGVPLFQTESHLTQRHLLELLHECYPGDGWIAPLRPDPLGDYLCEVELLKDPVTMRAIYAQYGVRNQ